MPRLSSLTTQSSLASPNWVRYSPQEVLAQESYTDTGRVAKEPLKKIPPRQLQLPFRMLKLRFPPANASVSVSKPTRCYSFRLYVTETALMRFFIVPQL